MRIIEVDVECSGRGDRVEIFPFFDLHVGKANCNEGAIRKQVQEVVKRAQMPGRHVRVLLGGDVVNAISSQDRKRFDFSDVADWVVTGNPQEILEALGDLPAREIERAKQILNPICHLIDGALEGNHEKALRKYHNMDVQDALCGALGCRNLSDEALVRYRFIRRTGQTRATTNIVVYLRHGYGAGRSAGAEPTKLATMLAEWECADVCLSGHSHTFCVLPPKAVADLPKRRGNSAEELIWRHRFAANPGSWLDSHKIGRGTYESQSCYPARAHMTCKIVVWPFYEQRAGDSYFQTPKIENRSYAIL